MIKKVDELLTARIDAVQHTNGLTRLWQALNLIQETSAPSDEVTKTLQPFADAATIDQALDGLVDQGLVRRLSSGLLEPTAEGAKLHQRALESQRTVRHRVVEGIDGADYATRPRAPAIGGTSNE